MSTPAATGRRIGRFELRRVLGQGAQATVWLAHDPRLEREVALKLLDASAAASVDEWLAEARSVSRLTHPNVVPVFEADQAAGQPYLVFELVEGRTLAEAMRQRTAWGARDAVTLMLGVLQAVAAAHAQGLVHRDLKPSNVLLGADGRPRVMDFGIAARVKGEADGRIVGTPGYISPEAARGDPPVPAMDVFSAGVVLAELLSGQRLLRETDPHRALQRVQREDLRLPPVPGVDDTLRGIVQRALSRDAAERYENAQALHDVLAAWLQPLGDAPAADTGGHGTLEFLLRRMRLKGDFPALSESVARIQRVATSETESLASLTAEILKDVALTNKLLRLVNTAHFSATTGGAVSTVSRAVQLIGFAGIRNMALSLLLLESMQDKDHAQLLKTQFLRALMAGQMASQLAFNPRDGEESFLGSMFQNLGRLLTEYYFPEEAREISSQLETGGDGAERREKVSAHVLGIGFEELGVGVARTWGLPDKLLHCMRPPAGDAPARPVDKGAERQRWICRVGNELAEVMMSSDGDELERRLREIGQRFASALGMPARSIIEATHAGRERIAELAPAMGLTLSSGAPRPKPVPPPAAAADDARTLVIAEPGASAELLSAGIQDITHHMVSEEFKLNEVLRLVLQTMVRALGFRRVVFALRDPKTETLTGRFGLGDGVDATVKALKVPLKGAVEADLFSAVCAKGVDTLIADATASNIAARLPAWFRQGIGAPSFLLLPLVMKNATFGLIYADQGLPGALAIGEKELALLRTLRNQAVMAFRQADRS